ncbi:ABC transporter permease [Clostridium sp. CCUG 7971]|uniref:ABC transporter permease n=1 Tax=Clostridium sp. CCUG 7971 TaxID=2811414 RepID=UPI001ABA2B36|nr:ABC transporter permease [Clostridium sp. CCUG 7971]MBO3444289.1 ABC transporter permease [Clostridium sp. CCUG 7971]
MKVQELINITFINLIENKLKVILTSLGIIVGTATIIMVIAIGKGGEEDVKKQFEGLSAGSIYINLNFENPDLDIKEVVPLDEEKMQSIMDDSNNISKVTLSVQGFTSIKVRGKEGFESVVGITNEFNDINNLNIQFGESLNEYHQEGKDKVCVLGESLAQQYFIDAESAIGETIKINEKTYKIIGILDRKGDGTQGLSPDKSIFIPYSSAYKYVYDEKNYIPQGTALVDDINKVENGIRDVQSSLDYIFDEEAVNFNVEDAGSKIEAALASAKTMNVLLMSVATIVFIVGGIGIMNVLFVAVNERTKEIGILKALGSSGKDILIQFLLESVIISSFGGICGIILSYLLMPLTKYLGVPVLFTIDGQVIALSFAIITGTVFGIYPAYKASKLKPVEALSYE